MTLLVAIVVYLAFFSMGLPDSMIGAAWPSIYPQFGVPVASAGGITLLTTAGTVLAALGANTLTHRLGAWRLTVLSTALTALALAGFALAPGYIALCCCALPLGLGAGAIDAALNNYVALNGTSRQMSWVHVAWGIGATTGPCLLGWCLMRGNFWQGGYWCVAALQTLMMGVLFCSRPWWKKEALTSGGREVVTTREALRLKGIGWALSGLFAMQGLEFCAGIWAGSYFHLVGGLSAAAAAKWAALFYGGMTVGRFFAGFVADRLGDRWMLRLGSVCVFIGVIALLFAGNNGQRIAGMAFVGLGVAPLFPCFLHATPTHFGARYTQAVMGLQMACAYTGAAVMPPFLGIVAQQASMAVYPCFLGGFLLTMVLALRMLYRARSHS